MAAGNANQRFVDIAFNHMDALYTKAIRATNNVRLAEYFVQLTYEKAHYLFYQFDWKDDFGEWLLQIFDDVYINQHLNQLGGEQNQEILVNRK